jgi:hypothetical protein
VETKLIKIATTFIASGAIVLSTLVPVTAQAAQASTPVRCRVAPQPARPGYVQKSLWYCDSTGKPTYEEDFAANSDRTSGVILDAAEAKSLDAGTSADADVVAMTTHISDGSIVWDATDTNPAWYWRRVGPLTYEAVLLSDWIPQ